MRQPIGAKFLKGVAHLVARHDTFEQLVGSKGHTAKVNGGEIFARLVVEQHFGRMLRLAPPAIGNAREEMTVARHGVFEVYLIPVSVHHLGYRISGLRFGVVLKSEGGRVPIGIGHREIGYFPVRKVLLHQDEALRSFVIVLRQRTSIAHQPHPVERKRALSRFRQVYGCRLPVIMYCLPHNIDGRSPSNVPSITSRPVTPLTVVGNGHLRRLSLAGCGKNGYGVGLSARWRNTLVKWNLTHIMVAFLCNGWQGWHRAAQCTFRLFLI